MVSRLASLLFQPSFRAEERRTSSCPYPCACTWKTHRARFGFGPSIYIGRLRFLLDGRRGRVCTRPRPRSWSAHFAGLAACVTGTYSPAILWRSVRSRVFKPTNPAFRGQNTVGTILRRRHCFAATCTPLRASLHVTTGDNGSHLFADRNHTVATLPAAAVSSPRCRLVRIATSSILPAPRHPPRCQRAQRLPSSRARDLPHPPHVPSRRRRPHRTLVACRCRLWRSRRRTRTSPMSNAVPWPSFSPLLNAYAHPRTSRHVPGFTPSARLLRQ